jgi:CubicO group peptidase (beta-lactamase class C family)
LARIDAVMQRHVDSGRPPGVITVVARHGKLAHWGCYGLRDVEGRQPMQPDTLLRMYSMTKPVTAVATMMLHEEGRFVLAEPVAKYISELGKMRVWAGEKDGKTELVDCQRPITIQDLLTQTSGLAYGLWPGTPIEDLYAHAGICSFERVLCVPLGEMVRRLAELPLAHQPGAAFRYGLNLDVLGRLVSILSDMPFDVFLRERIFAPLGMAETSFYVPQAKLHRFAPLYDGLEPGRVRLVDAATEASPFADADCAPSGGGGLVSTAADQLRFAQMLCNGGALDGVRLLGPRTLARMVTNHLAPCMLPMVIGGFPWPGAGYGLGFGVCVDATQRPFTEPAGSFGWPGAAGTRFWVDAKEGLVGLILPQVRNMVVPLGGMFQSMVYGAMVE